MSRLFSISFIFLLIFLSNIFAQTTRNISNRTYLKKDGKWYIQPKGTEGEFLLDTLSITVKLNEGVSFAVLNELISGTNIEIERQNKLGFIDLKIPEGKDCFKIAAEISNTGYFENVEINSFGETYGTDPGYSNQYYLHNTTYDYSGYSYLDIDATYSQTWAIEDGSSNQVTVAVIDLGVKTDHTDLLMVSGYGYDFEDDDEYPDPINDDDHGTSVAGIVGARTYNSTDIAGVAGGYNSNGTKIMALRIGSGDHSWPYSPITVSVVDDAIIYAADNGARIINMSFGCTQYSSINAALYYAYAEKGCLLVAASGNNSGQNQFSYPASNMYVMAVGGIDQDWDPYGSWDGPLEVVAPSTNIVSLTNSGYGNVGNGTSYSTPQVSGIAALLFSYDPTILHMDTRKIINQTALNLDAIDNEKFGNGLAKAGNALGVLSSPASWTYPEPPQISIYAPHGQNPTISWTKVEDDYDYIIYRAHSQDGRYHFVYKGIVEYDPGENNYSWTDNSVTVDRFGSYNYYYRVVSSWLDLESILSNEVSCKSNQTQKEDQITTTLTPGRFALEQNYPNPFNPLTKIRFSIADDSFVSLIIFNNHGQQVKVLAEKNYEKGEHELTFYAEDLASGVYYYKLKSGKNIAVKKMLFIK